MFYFVLVSNYADCQVNIVDSLEQVLKKEKNELKQIDLLNDLFSASSDSDFERGLQYALLALKKSNALEENSKEKKEKISQSENNVGIAYLQLAKYDLALDHLIQSLNIAEDLKDTVRISNAINNIGALYGYKGELELAFDYFSKSAELDEATGNIEGACSSLTNISAYYFGVSEYEKGKVYYDKAMKMAKEAHLTNNMATLYSGHAQGLRNEKRYKDALKFYELAISIRKDEDDLGSLVSLYINMSSLYLKVNKRKKADEYAEMALELALILNSPDDIMRSYQSIADVNEKSGNMGKAFENYKKSIAWKDTIYSIKSEEVMAEMTAKYNYEKKEKENEILRQEKAISDLEFKNQQKELESSRIIMFSAVGGGVLLLLLAFTLYNRNKLKQKANDELLLVNNNLLEAKNIIEEKNRDITASIEYAKYIQQAILPKKEKVDECFSESFLMLLPKDVVSGDFYWFQQFGKYSVLVMADCTGHGVPGGFMSMMGAEMLNQVLSDPEIVDAGVALAEIDKRIKNNLNQVGSARQQNDGMDMALCIFNKENNVLQYAGANRPLVMVRDGQLTMIKPDKFGVGGLLGFEKEFTTNHITLEKGDCFYMYSDGYPDQFGGPKNKKFMRKRLNALILEQSANPMVKQHETYLQAFNNWKGTVEQIDDVCLVGVRV